MDMKVSYVQGKVPGAVLALNGDLDASNYVQVIDKVREAYAQGIRAMVLDLGGVRFVSSSGLVAIHSAALIMQGKAPPDLDQGWAAIHAGSAAVARSAQECLMIANPQPRVALTLEKVGFKDAFQIYPTVEAAVANV